MLVSLLLGFRTPVFRSRTQTIEAMMLRTMIQIPRSELGLGSRKPSTSPMMNPIGGIATAVM